MSVERIAQRIKAEVEPLLPPMFKAFGDKITPALTDINLKLMLETLENDCPDLLRQIDAAPARYPDLHAKLTHARQSRAKRA